MSILDNLPLASIVSIVSIVLAVIAYVNGDLSIEEAFLAVGAVTGGSGVLGVARAQSGKGVRR